jgi:hypothetical protein
LILLNEIATTNFFTFDGVIFSYLPPIAVPVPTTTRHLGAHTFTICMASKRFGPDLNFSEWRGGEDKPVSNNDILSPVLTSQLELKFHLIFFIALTTRRRIGSNRMWSLYQESC